MFQTQDEAVLIKFEETLILSALSSSTITNYLADLRAFLRWGKSEIGDEFSLLVATSEHIRLYRAYLARQLKRAVSTINRHLMAQRKFFAFVVDRGLIAVNPASGVALLQTNGQASSRPISEAEIEKLLAAAQNGSRAALVRRDQAILDLLLHTGLRVSEIIELQKDDLIFDNPGVHLEVNSHDKNKTRTLPLSGPVCQVLYDYLLVRSRTTAANHFFLSQDGRPISVRTVQRIISDCAKSAGLKGVSAQSLRRTFALHLLSETKDIGLVSQRLGHQTTAITEQYLAVHNEQQS